MERILTESNLRVDGVIALVVNPEEVVHRMTSRRTCKKCGAITSILDPKVAESQKCPACGSKELLTRDDDREEVIRRRIETYYNDTQPLAEYYRNLSLLHEVDGRGSVEEVSQRITGVLERITRKSARKGAEDAR